MPVVTGEALAYEVHQATLANGLRVVVNPDPASPVVAVNLWYDVGSAHETAGRTGFAHLFEHLMFDGTAQAGPGEQLAALQAVGGEVNATTSFDRTNYYETVPAEAVPLALWFEADRLGHLADAIGQDTLDTEREVVKEEKRERYDNVPFGDAYGHIVDLCFGANHPYGHLPIGSMADLDAATVDDVGAFFRTHYRPANAVLTLSGAIGRDEALALADAYLGALPASGRPDPLTLAPLPPLDGSPRRELVRDVPQAAVYLAWRLPAYGSTAHEALDLALAILGDGLSSRLHAGLVRAGLADTAGAGAWDLTRGTSLGVITATPLAGTDPAAVEAAIMGIVAEFLEQGPAEAEWQRAQAQATHDWLDGLAYAGSRADALSESAMVLGDAGRVNTWLAELAAIRPDEVQDLARRWLDPAQAAALVYRPEGA